MIDVVYTLSDQSIWKDNELRHSLRSLKHLKDLNQVWIIGHKPDFVQNVNHIPFPDSYTRNKDANLIQKLIRACLEPSLTDEYIFMSDDQYLLQELSAEDFKAWALQNVRHHKFQNPNRWKRRMMRLRDTLVHRGLPAYNYEAHIPYKHNKHDYARIMLSFDYGAEEGYTVNSPYFNSVITEPVMLENHVVSRIVRPQDYQEIKQEISGKMFLNHNDPALNGNMKKMLRDLFPEKSKFESDG